MSKRERETPEFAAFARRAIRALGRRCAASDPTDLRELVAMKAEIDAATLTAIRGLLELGFSYAEIAAGLGTSKQAVQQRYARAGDAGIHDFTRKKEHTPSPSTRGVTPHTLAG